MDEWCNEKRERMFVVELLTYLDDMCFAAMDCEKNASICAGFMYAALLKRLHHIDGYT